VHTDGVSRAVASHLLVEVLTTLLRVLKIKDKMFGCTHPHPLMGAFNGQVENLTSNFSPLTILAGASRVHSAYRSLMNIIVMSLSAAVTKLCVGDMCPRYPR